MRVGPLPAGRGPAAEAGLNYRGRPLVPQPWSLLALGESYKPMLRGTRWARGEARPGARRVAPRPEGERRVAAT